MMKSNTGSTPANNTDEILHNKTPQHQPRTINRVTHRSLAMPLGQGVTRGRVEVSFNTTVSQQGSSCPLKGHLFDSPVTGRLN